MSWSFTSSGITLNELPPWMDPTVTTAGSNGEVSRLTMVCRASTIWEASTMGSFALWGTAPWPPTPRTVMSTASTLAMMGPSV